MISITTKFLNHIKQEVTPPESLPIRLVVTQSLYDNHCLYDSMMQANPCIHFTLFSNRIATQKYQYDITSIEELQDKGIDILKGTEYVGVYNLTPYDITSGLLDGVEYGEVLSLTGEE
jgi:hypothetical protein